eukprot:Gb_39379 [translate_table: standard]
MALWQEASHGQNYAQESDTKNSLQKCTVKLFLHVSGKIAAKFGYQQQLVAAFRTIPKAEWNAKERLWMFPSSSLQDAEKTLAEINALTVDVETLDPLVRRALEAAASLPNLKGLGALQHTEAAPVAPAHPEQTIFSVSVLSLVWKMGKIYFEFFVEMLTIIFKLVIHKAMSRLMKRCGERILVSFLKKLGEKLMFKRCKGVS